MDKAFVENSVQLVIRFDDTIVANTRVHPNMVVLPSAGDTYSFEETEHATSITGFVDRVEMRHVIDNEDGHIMFRQVITLHCYTYQPDA